MPRKVIQPKTLNDPRPRYSQGILNSGGKLLFVAGQTASDKDGNVVGKGDCLVLGARRQDLPFRSRFCKCRQGD